VSGDEVAESLLAEAEAGYDPAKVGPNLANISPREAMSWKAFGQAVLLLCDSPFAEWTIAPEPALGKAAVQVRELAARYGVSR
jgi:hypothetical protein